MEHGQGFCWSWNRISKGEAKLCSEHSSWGDTSDHYVDEGFPLMTILYTTHPYLLIANMRIKIQNTTNKLPNTKYNKQYTKTECLMRDLKVITIDRWNKSNSELQALITVQREWYWSLKKKNLKCPKSYLARKIYIGWGTFACRSLCFPLHHYWSIFFICFVFVFQECCICCFICSVFVVAQQERYEWEDSCRLLCFTLRHSWRGRGVVTTNLPDCPTYYPLTKLILNIWSWYVLK